MIIDIDELSLSRVLSLNTETERNAFWNNLTPMEFAYYAGLLKKYVDEIADLENQIIEFIDKVDNNE